MRCLPQFPTRISALVSVPVQALISAIAAIPPARPPLGAFESLRAVPASAAARV
ncbi:hypothetical protein PTE31013_03056 [Pandoraea terrigena]|uniref:Uncharacterized protein n=1 Tax=Pandoraea terrigena TaxID=2508292 RepID=A0A5E4W7G8_9BURK|nr:hypothetical protein PTE31013_03056 [Pandoraea terrigena]